MIESSDNYNTSGILWQFKRDEQPMNNNEVFIDITAEDSSSFKYKSNLIGNTVVDVANSIKERIKIAVPLKYLSNLWRSLEMSLINYKVEISLKWYANCILSSAGTAATFTTTDARFYVPVVALKIEENTKL